MSECLLCALRWTAARKATTYSTRESGIFRLPRTVRPFRAVRNYYGLSDVPHNRRKLEKAAEAARVTSGTKDTGNIQKYPVWVLEDVFDVSPKLEAPVPRRRGQLERRMKRIEDRLILRLQTTRGVQNVAELENDRMQQFRIKQIFRNEAMKIFLGKFGTEFSEDALAMAIFPLADIRVRWGVLRSKNGVQETSESDESRNSAIPGSDPNSEPQIENISAPSFQADSELKFPHISDQKVQSSALAAIGRNLLRLTAVLHVLDFTPRDGGYAEVGGLPMEVLQSFRERQIVGRSIVAEFCRRTKLDVKIDYAPHNVVVKRGRFDSGGITMLQKEIMLADLAVIPEPHEYDKQEAVLRMVHVLVGLIHSAFGRERAVEFITEKLLNGPGGLYERYCEARLKRAASSR